MPEIAAVGGIAVRSGAVLLIRRGRPPDVGKWSLPGGRVEPGETDRVAVVREMLEETGLQTRVERLVGEVMRPGPGDVVYRIRDYLVEVMDDARSTRAGDDAAAVEWVPFGEVAERELTAGLVDALREWRILP